MHRHPLGSQWNLWDLHFHTPSSFDYQNHSVTDEQLVDGLIEANVRVVAITDHHRIDVARIRSLQSLGRDRLTVLPGIELRSDFGGKPIHYIGIFPEEIDLDHLWAAIRGKLDLIPPKKGRDDWERSVYVPLRKAHEAFHPFRGIISIHAGGKSNSIEEISNAERFQQRLKLDITTQFVDLLEIGKYGDISSYRDKVFPATGLHLPLVAGSDNHNIETYAPRIPCWIKATPTFLGLRQTLNEPTERIQLGGRPAVLDLVSEHPHRYIREISLAKLHGAPLDEVWFDGVRVLLNPGLVAVIGNKGSGKSALTDIIGLLGESRHESSFSFLQKHQFKFPKANKARWFDATLTWWSGEPVRKNLDEPVDSTAAETVRYIPQDHLEAICDELRGGREGSFEDELKAVIFSRVPAAQRRHFSTLDEIIEFRTDQSQQRLDLLRQQLQTVNHAVTKLEQEAEPDHRRSLEAQLEEAQREVEAHRKNRPPVVNKPDDDETVVRQQSETSRAIEELARKSHQRMESGASFLV